MNYINNIKYYGNIVIKKSNILHNKYLNRKNKYNVLNLVKNKNISFLPNILDCAYKNDIVITKMERIKGFKEFNNSIANDKFYDKLIQTINKFHKIDTKGSKIETFSYKNFFYNLYNNTKVHLYKLDLLELDKVIERLDKVKNKCFSHNDLVPNNILIINNTEEIKLIDFDFTSINNSLFDYASFLCDSLEEQKNINVFITSLFRNNILNKDNVRNFKDEIYYQDRLWLVWANYCYEIVKEQEDKIKANEILKTLDTEKKEKEEELKNKKTELDQLDEMISNSEETKDKDVKKATQLSNVVNQLKEEYDNFIEKYNSIINSSVAEILLHSNTILNHKKCKRHIEKNIKLKSQYFLEIHSKKVDLLETRLISL